MKQEIVVETVQFNAIEPDPNNLRKHTDRNITAISKSLDRFGQRRPLVIWQNKVIAGNGTMEAAKRLGWETIAITRVPDNWTREEATAYAIADNRTSELASWDDVALAVSLDELKTFDLLDVTGFGVTDLDDLRVNFDDTPAPTGTVTTPELQDYIDRYKDKTVRILMMELPDDVYLWAIGKLTILRDELGISSNAAVLLHLLGQAVDETPPALD